MAFSHSCRILWFASVIFVILPHFNLGLLSDYKICGDSECESFMSRAQAMRDHRGKDCRFLSFRRGDTILVYHKLTGKREDLWAGTIDRQFGYFPKDAVQEEQVYAAAEKVVETQKSDFICMDEHGYPIDSSHLDNSDEDGDNDQNIQNQESETIQTIVHTDDSSAEHPSASIDSTSESPDQPDATSREEDKNQKSGSTASATREDTHETPAALGEQGGSPSSSWLGSSVTGWLGMGKDEQSGNMPEREEPQEEVSLTSSVTGWLGFGGEKKLDDTVNSREEDKEVAASFTSTMTGWLGLGDEKEADHATKEQHEERETDDASEPKETFRSRRISLDLEGSQLQEEEKEVGTLGWLGKGLSSTLGFGVTNLETDPIKEKKEKPTSSSWLDIGVGDILGFGKSESEIDKSSRNNIKETEKDSTPGEATPSDQVDISESQEDQKKTKPEIQRLEENVGMETSAEIGDTTFSSSSSTNTNESNVEEHVVDNFSPLESASVALTLEEDVHNDSIVVSDASESKSPPADAAATVDRENSSPQTTSEESLQPLDKTPPMTDEAGSAEATEGQQLPKSTGNGSGNNNRELEVEENKSTSDDRDIITQPDADLGSDLYSMESKGQYLENTDRAEHVEDDGTKIIKQVEQEESTMVGLELGGNSYSHEKTNVERDKRHLDIYPTLTGSDEISRDEGSRGQNQSSSSSDTHKEENEPTHSEEDSVTAHSVKTGNLDTVVTTEDSKNERESYNTGVQNRDVHSESGPSLYVNPPEDQMLIIHRKDPEPGSPENEEVIALKEKQEEFEEKSKVKDGERQQRVEERKQKEDKIKEEEMQEEVHELQKKEKQEDVKKVKEEEKQGEMEDEEGNPDGKEELKEDIQEEGDDVQEEMRQEERGEGGENTKLEVKELKEEEKEGDEEMVEVEGANEGEKQGGQGESEKRENEQEAASVEEKQDEVESVEEEKELMEVKEEEKQDRTKEFQVEEKEVELEEFRKGKEETEQQDEERQQTIAGSKEEEEEREKEIHKSKEEEIREKLNELNDSKEKGKETIVQVPHLETQKTNIHDIFESELEISEETHDDNTKTEENKRAEEQVTHDETQQLADVEEELRDEEEEESPKCSNKPCHQAPEYEPAEVRNEEPRSTDDSMIQQNKQVLESETMSSEGTETDRLREEEPDKASDDSDEGGETAITLNATGNENTYSNNVNIADHKGLKVEQIGAAPYADNDQRPAGESGHSGRTGTLLGETWETKKHDHQAENDTVSQGSVGSGANNRVKVENASGGAFGLFENAFSFFSQTPASKTKEPTASTPSVDTNTAETSTPQASLPVEQESDSTQFNPNSNQVPVQENHKHSPVSISTQQQRQPAPVSAPSPSPETKSLSKYYKNLLGHISVEELTYLLDLFGRNKLQFLDYILGSSESQTDDPDNDESILSDIERLLHHHRETLATSQEVNENTKTLIALQKLEMLLKKLSDNTRKSDVSKATLQADGSCVGGSCSTNAKDKKEPKGIQDFAEAKDTKAQRDTRKAEERDKGQAGGVTEESREDEVWKGRQKETQTHPHIQPGSPQPQEGVMKQSLEFVRQIVTDSITYAHASREVLIGITAQHIVIMYSW